MSNRDVTSPLTMTSTGDEAAERAIVPVARLMPADSPRTDGLDREHVARLAETVGPMPPILVRRDMRVVDGMHRLSAAMMRGQATIEVEYFEGSPDDAFLRAVELNVVHGLPLSLADRQAAAKRIMISHPQLSDRAIARTAGLGNKSVAALRRSLSGSLPEVKARLGRDGRLRPVCAAEGRRRAAEVIASNPQASLREVARIAGVAPGTVGDVRRRLERGQPPAPEPTRTGRGGGRSKGRSFAARELFRSPELVQEPAEAWRGKGDAVASRPDPVATLKKLLRDPSLRLNEEGRLLLRVLQQNAAAERSDFADAVPSHCEELVSCLARHYAETWMRLAHELEKRVAAQGEEQERDTGCGSSPSSPRSDESLVSEERTAARVRRNPAWPWTHNRTPC